MNASGGPRLIAIQFAPVKAAFARPAAHDDSLEMP